MKKLLARRPVKALLSALLIVSAVITFWSSVLVLNYWDDVWTSNGEYRNSDDCDYLMMIYRNHAWDLLDYTLTEELSYAQRKDQENLQELLAPENTNFRYQIRDAEGNLVLGNVDGAMDRQFDSVYLHERQIRASATVDGDHLISVYDPQGEPSGILVVDTGSDYLTFDPQTMDRGELAGAQVYGWVWNPAGEDAEGLHIGYWDWTEELDVRSSVTVYTVESALAEPMLAEDGFAAGAERYGEWLNDARRLIPLAAAGLLATLLLLILLMTAAGRTSGRTGVTLTWWDRSWYEGHIAAAVLLLCLVLQLGDPIAFAWNQEGGQRVSVIAALACLSGVMAGCALELCWTAAVRLKARMFWQTTLAFRLARWLARGCRALWNAVLALPMFGRAAALFVLYLAGTILTAHPLIFLVYQGAVLFLICRWIRQWRTIRAAADRMSGGEVECRIDTRGMYHDLKEHAQQLNSLSDGLSKAVAERMKSERFKSELITNVSHDLKTPLTSIINYVDLLKKEDIDNPKAAEYLEVLERKSQRLKKLTEDLVEASKASTGNLAVQRERLNAAQLADQALAEYSDRLTASGLTVVAALPEEPVYVWADGRHLWRVLDNLLSNCCKYAMPATRVYVDVYAWEDQVTIQVKNVSREPLNIPAERLMERFVRGDDSRTTEGSGLGLSIARSLTELQGGEFRLEVDGDLFKASVVFPRAPEEAPPQAGLPDREI